MAKDQHEHTALELHVGSISRLGKPSIDVASKLIEVLGRSDELLMSENANGDIVLHYVYFSIYSIEVQRRKLEYNIDIFELVLLQ